MPTLKDLPTRLLHDPFNAPRMEQATHAPFLHRAGFGFGFVNAKTLCSWLVQDLRYTQAYIRFASGLLSCVRLPGSESTVNSESEGAGRSRRNTKAASSVTEKSADQRVKTATVQRAIDLLLGALNNVRREQKFFVETVQKYDLSSLYAEAEREAIEAGGMNAATRKYAALFDSFAAGGDMYGCQEADAADERPHKARKGTADQTAQTASPAAAESELAGQVSASPSNDLETLYLGLLVLWATEWCYYTAWSYVDTLTVAARRPWSVGDIRKWFAERPWAGHGTAEEKDHDKAKMALFEDFLPNWTSKEFKDFVKECEECLNAVGELLVAEGDDERVKRVQSRAQDVFREVLELEKNFWPAVD